MARTIHDVAAFVLRERGAMTAMKLEKLVYYSQAWALVWDGRPLFPDVFEGWKNGPVARSLWKHHAQRFDVQTWPEGNADALDDAERATVSAVLEFYGPLDPETLSALTHREGPWRSARRGLAEDARGSAPISHEAMRRYYGAGAEPGGRKAISEAFSRGCWVLLQMPADEVDLLDVDALEGDDARAYLDTGVDPSGREA